MTTTRNADRAHCESSVLDTVVTTFLLAVGFAGACVLAIVATGALVG